MECNGKLVQVIPSSPIKSSDNPPTNLEIFGIAKYSFKLSDAVNVLIFSFANIQTQKTDCAVINRNELIKRLKPYHWDEDKIHMTLVLSERGLHECFNTGAEGWFMALWVNDLRNFSSYHNNWSIFNMYITNFQHYLDEEGNIPTNMPKEARELANFLALLVDYASGGCDAESFIRCIKKDCEGLIVAFITDNPDEIYWVCPICKTKGVITDWYRTEWDNS